MENRIKKLLVGFFVIMLIFTFLSRAAASALVAKVQVANITRDNLVYKAKGTGIIKADAHKYVNLLDGYKVGEVYIKEGQEVDVGDLLFYYDMNSVQEKKSDLEAELEKLKLEYDAIGLTDPSISDPAEIETAALAAKVAKEDIKRAENNLGDIQKYEKDKKVKEYKEAVSEWEKLVASKVEAEIEKERKVSDAEAELAKLKEPEARAELLINNYIASFASPNELLIDKEYDRIFDFYYDGQYKEHQQKVSEAEKKLARAQDDLVATQDKWDKIVFNFDPYAKDEEKNSYYEKLKSKNDEINNAKRMEADAKESLYQLTKEDKILEDAISTYRSYVESNSEYASISFGALLKRLTEGKTTDQSEIDAATRKLSRAKEDKESNSIAWGKKIEDAIEKKNQLNQSIQAMEDGSYDYTEVLKEENKALEEGKRALTRAELQLTQLENTKESAIENQKKQEASNTIQRDILEIDRKSKEKELKIIKGIISKEGAVHTTVAGIIKVSQVEEGITLSGQEKLIITTGGYQLNMKTDMEDMKYFATGDEVTIKTGADNATIISQIENIELPDENGKVSFTALLPEGDYKIDGSLDFELTKESMTYSMCIPIQAIREDREGAYVLLVKDKDSVLGKVQEAFRMKVTVLSMDDKWSAIEAAISKEDAIIIGGNKNFSEGDRVRIYEME